LRLRILDLEPIIVIRTS